MKDKCGNTVKSVKKANCQGKLEEVTLGSLGGKCPPKGKVKTKKPFKR